MRTSISQHGFVTLAAVTMLLAVGVAAALVALLAAWQSVDGQTAWGVRVRASAIADACAETVRSRLWEEPEYTGSESFSLLTGRCAVLPLAVSSGSYDVQTEGSVMSTVIRVHAEYALTADASGSVQTLERVSYERVAEF